MQARDAAARWDDAPGDGGSPGRHVDFIGSVEGDATRHHGVEGIVDHPPPLTHEGDALFHIARFDDNREAQATFDEFQETHSVEPAWG